MDQNQHNPEAGGLFPEDPDHDHLASVEAVARSGRETAGSPARIALIVLGVGKVGRALLRQIQRHRQLHETVFGTIFDLVAVSDSTAALLLEDPSQLDSILDWKERGQELAHHSRATLIPDAEALVEAVAEAGAVLVDCTASDSTLPALLMGVEKGCRIVTANKRPLTESLHHFQSLSGPFPGYPQCRWASTVGAGLPVISTLNRLRASGDEITRITGSLSSTLGNIFTGLEQGKRMSALVQEAIEKGVAEPDPREDLSGRDLARKALILARTCGWKAELGGVQVEPLYPESMEDLPAADFVQRLALLDQGLEERHRKAHQKSCRLRYTVELSRRGIRVGLQEILGDHPLARLCGSEQLIAIETAIYRDTPLVIRGRGTGVEATASAVLADILELCRFSVR